jgi:chromosome segregation ATPase
VEERRTLKDLDQALREAQNRWVRVQKARGSMPNNTGEFAARVASLRARLEGAQTRLAAVARQQNSLLESLARTELEQQKERIGTYQIQARFALAAIYDRAAAPPAAPKAAPQESQGELESVPADAPMDGAPPLPDTSTSSSPTDSAAPAVDTSQAPPETEAPK